MLRSLISIPSGNVLQSSSLLRYASTGCLTPGLTRSDAILARALVKSRTLLFRDSETRAVSDS